MYVAYIQEKSTIFVYKYTKLTSTASVSLFLTQQSIKKIATCLKLLEDIDFERFKIVIQLCKGLGYGTGVVPGQHTNLIAIFRHISYPYRVLYFGH